MKKRTGRKPQDGVMRGALSFSFIQAGPVAFIVGLLFQIPIRAVNLPMSLGLLMNIRFIRVY